MRPHLSEATIKEIYIGFLANEPKKAIARRLEIDRRTVQYHIAKIDGLPEERVISLISAHALPPSCNGGHTALRCLVCGIASDNMRSDEYRQIVILRRRIINLEQALKSRHEVNISHDRVSYSFSASPVVRIAG